MSKIKELFHSIPNYLNAISVISFTVADALERQDIKLIDEAEMKRLGAKFDADIILMEEACKSSEVELETLSNLIRNEMDLAIETEHIFREIGGEFEKIECLLGKIKSFNINNKTQLSFLVDDMYSFEKDCINLAQKLKELKSKLVALNCYK